MWDQRDLSLVRPGQNTDERSRGMEACFGQRRIGFEQERNVMVRKEHIVRRWGFLCAKVDGRRSQKCGSMIH